MTDNSRELSAQLKEMAIQNEIDTQVAIRKLMLATAQLLETTDPEIIGEMKRDIDNLKKRDWYGLTVAAIIALLTSAMAYFKK